MKEKLALYGDVLENVSLKEYNTFRIGGLCHYMISPFTVLDLQNLLSFLQLQHICYFVLGNGSNVIFSDDFFEGVVIRLNHFDQIEFSGLRVNAEAGVLLPKLASLSIQQSLTGLEWAIGIPGTVGGSVFGNAGAYNSCIFDLLEQVTVLTMQGEIQNLKKDEITYGYRTTYFKENPEYIILKATFLLAAGNKEESQERVHTRQMKRRATQPLEYPNAGSVFRNPSSDNPSGRIIESLGLKGMQVGGAKVSEKHANFIINTGNATSNDVRNLIELVHQRVQDECNIDLVMEQEYVGWDQYEKENK